MEASASGAGGFASRPLSFADEADIPSPRNDILSHILTIIRLQGEVVRSDELGFAARAAFSAGSGHFHLVQAGELILHPSAGAPLLLKSGESVLLPRGNGHVVVGGDPMMADATDNTWETGSDGRSQPTEHTGADFNVAAKFLSASFRFDTGPLSSLLSRLPEVIQLERGESGAPPWLAAISHFLLEEARTCSPGGRLMISRLIDLLVIRTLRTWATTQADRVGWLTGLSDERIGRALSAMHSAPNREWTVESLAKIATMSRSLFAERFTAALGDPPSRYLTKWRLTLAADLLRSGGLKVTEVAQRTGYASDAAFSRAFKAYFGHPPSDVAVQAAGMTVLPATHR